MGKRAYSYIRFSTPEQQQGDSQRRQIALAEAYARKNGLTLDDEFTFHDLGVSGFRGKNASERGKLGAFLEAVRLGAVERGSYLLVEGLDRLSRMTPRKALRVLEDICDEGITVVTLSGMNGQRRYTSKSLDDPMELFGTLVEFTRANQESEWKAARLKAAWDGKRQVIGDRPLTAKCPGWLELDKRTGKFKFAPGRRRVVQRIFREVLKGYGLQKIAAGLNRDGVEVFGDGKRKGKFWHRSYVAKIVNNEAVVGTFIPHVLEYDGGKRTRRPLESIRDYYPAAIPREKFERVKAMREGTRAPLRGRHASGTVRNLIGGLGRCALCGETMTRVYKGKPPKGGTYLVCTKAKAGKGCTYRLLKYQPIEDAIRENAAWLVATAPAGAKGDDLDERLERLEANIAGMDEAIENVLDAIQRGEMAGKGSRSRSLQMRLRKLETERESLANERDDVLQQQARKQGAITRHKLDDLKAAFQAEAFDHTATNALLRQVFDGVTVDAKAGTLTFHWKHGGESEVIFGFPEDA